MGVEHLHHDGARLPLAAFVNADVIGVSGADNVCFFQSVEAALSAFEDDYSARSFAPFCRNQYADGWLQLKAQCMDALSGELDTGLPSSELRKVCWLLLSSSSCS